MKKEWATRISRVLERQVVIRRYSHEDLIGGPSYVTGVYLTLKGVLPDPQQERMVATMLQSLYDHGFVAASVLAARYCASRNPQFVSATVAGLLTADNNTINPKHGVDFVPAAHARMFENGQPDALRRSMATHVDTRNARRALGTG